MTTESLVSRVPENTNLIQKTKFHFIMPNLPFAKYFCQTVNLPGITTSPVKVETPFSATWRHGDKLEYDALSVTFLVDEDLRVWEETYNWLIGLTFPENFDQYKKFGRPQPSATKEIYYDGILTINTNANLPNLRLNFRNCHPVSLSGLDFSSTSSSEETITATLVLRYDYYTLTRI